MTDLREEVTTIKIYGKCDKKILENDFRGEVGSHKQHFGIMGHVKEERESLNCDLLVTLIASSYGNNKAEG